jgi:hypothetical protein
LTTSTNTQQIKRKKPARSAFFFLKRKILPRKRLV